MVRIRRGTGAGLLSFAAAILGFGVMLPAGAQTDPTTTTTAPSPTTTAPTTTAPSPTTTVPTTTTTAPPPASPPNLPPGWSNPGGGAWVAFTFDTTTLAAANHKGDKWGPVKIRRHSSAGLDLAAAFPGGWDSRPSSSDPNMPEYGWPEDWSLGGIGLKRVAWCDRAAPTCEYYATGGAGEALFFAAGAVPADQLATYDQGVLTLGTHVPVLDIVFSWDPSTSVTPAAGGTPGRLTLDASQSTDDLAGALRHEWTVTNQDSGQQFHASGAIATFELDANGNYCVAVTVTNENDPDNPATYGVTTPDCKPINNVAPGSGTTPGTTPGTAPGTSPGAGNGGGAGGGAGGINVVFAPPRRSSSALTGTAGGDSVVWLWRPEFFQPGAETTQALPQTGRNSLEGRTDIVIATDPAPDSNAAPMLAGLGIFGVVGVGWLFGRRRRIRAEF